MSRLTSMFVLFTVVMTTPLLAQTSLDDLTWQELRDAIKAGTTTVIVPIGGTEQNGPHMVLGKHNYIIAFAARLMAERLGQTLVAPVLQYVPQGNAPHRERQ